MDGHTERFGGLGAIVVCVGSGLAGAIFGCIGLLNSKRHHQGPGVVSFWVVFVALFLVIGLLKTHRATLSFESRLVFRSLLRRKTFWVEDIQRIEGRVGGQGGWYYRFRFNRGTATLPGRPGRALADRLLQLNPRLRINEDDD